MNEIKKAIDYFSGQNSEAMAYCNDSKHMDSDTEEMLLINQTAIKALRSQLTREQNELCEWQQEDEESSLYSSSCGYEFVFNDDGPNSNDFVYCPKCGKPIKEIQWELDE